MNKFALLLLLFSGAVGIMLAPSERRGWKVVQAAHPEDIVRVGFAPKVSLDSATE